jgi:hypothetical protein
MKSFSYRFDPPLCIPPQCTATIEPDNADVILDMVTKQPKFIRLVLKDASEATLADGLYERDEKEPDLYRLKEGTAYKP